MDPEPDIMPFTQRRYEEVPIDQIKVINSRDRDLTQFKMNVTSISELGLMKPIRVNDKFRDKTGFYELICGEGRLLAHKELGRSHILAEVVTCTRKDSYLQSLVENIARTKPGTMDFARRSDNCTMKDGALKKSVGSPVNRLSTFASTSG